MGLLSEATNNLVVAQNQLQALRGLPPPAQAICDRLRQLLVPVAPSVSALQTKATTVIVGMQGAVQQSLQLLDQMQPSDPVPGSIGALEESLTAQATSLGATVAAELPTVQTVSAVLPSMGNQLYQIQADLNSQRVNVQNQLSSEQSSLEAAKKKYYYLLALGPLGLVGLAVALALYKELTSKVNAIQVQISQLQAHQNIINSMTGVVGMLQNQITVIMPRLEGVNNTIRLISDTISDIASDLNNKGSPGVLKMAFGAAASELSVVSEDLS